MAVATIALAGSPNIPGQLHSLLGSAYFSLANVMACRVFRAVLLGFIKDPQMDTSDISSVVRPAMRKQRSDDYDTTLFKHHKSGLSPNSKVNLAIKVDTQTESSDGSILWDRTLAEERIRYDASHRV